MAGSYGLEIQTAAGETIYRVDFEDIRPFLDELKGTWQQLLEGRQGFYLEDKGWTLAIHAKDAMELDAGEILAQAGREANAVIEQSPGDLLHLQGGHRFLEIAPQAVDKKRTVQYLVATYPPEGKWLPVYLGDDDKDEVAFEAVQEQGGLVVAVGERLRESAADCWLPNPTAVRRWLEDLLEKRVEKAS
jgi:trehalose 6-phosphate phosphatase